MNQFTEWMGSPLGPVLAKRFIGHHKQHLLIREKLLSVIFYKRYVDKNIKFTIEKEQYQKLPFLDVLITKISYNRITKNDKKSTGIDFIINVLSFIPTRCKLGLVKTLVYGLYKIKNTWSGFHNEIEKT